MSTRTRTTDDADDDSMLCGAESCRRSATHGAFCSDHACSARTSFGGPPRPCGRQALPDMTACELHRAKPREVSARPTVRDADTRCDELEERVAALEAMLATPTAARGRAR